MNIEIFFHDLTEEMQQKLLDAGYDDNLANVLPIFEFDPDWADDEDEEE
ncbi:hypothetical protein [Leptospira santarosai]|nr:hypothetical protein [Leptospira santarosai]MDI7165937.1 hypothetical protein [Leptospira santarosai]MDO6383372.1 hypothetical protein [Leptospira santarosai]